MEDEGSRVLEEVTVSERRILPQEIKGDSQMSQVLDHINSSQHGSQHGSQYHHSKALQIDTNREDCDEEETRLLEGRVQKNSLSFDEFKNFSTFLGKCLVSISRIIQRVDLNTKLNFNNLENLFRASNGEEFNFDFQDQEGGSCCVPEEMIFDLTQSSSMKETLEVFKSGFKVIIDQMKAFSVFNSGFNVIYAEIEKSDQKFQLSPEKGANLIDYLQMSNGLLIKLFKQLLATRFQLLEKEKEIPKKQKFWIMSHYVTFIQQEIVDKLENNALEFTDGPEIRKVFEGIRSYLNEIYKKMINLEDIKDNKEVQKKESGAESKDENIEDKRIRVETFDQSCETNSIKNLIEIASMTDKWIGMESKGFSSFVPQLDQITQTEFNLDTEGGLKEEKIQDQVQNKDENEDLNSMNKVKEEKLKKMIFLNQELLKKVEEIQKERIDEENMKNEATLELIEEIDSLKDQLSKSNVDTDALKETYETHFQKSSEGMNKILQDAENEIKLLNEHILGLKGNSSAKIMALEQQIIQLTSQNETLSSKLIESAEKQKVLQTNQELTLSTLQQQFDEEVKSLKITINDKEESLKMTTLNKDELSEALTAQVQDLKSQIENLQSEKKGQHHSIEELNFKNSQLTQSILDIESEKIELQESINSLKSDFSGMKQVAEDKVLQYKESNDRNKEVIQDQSIELKRLDSENKTLYQKLQIIKVSFEEYKLKVDNSIQDEKTKHAQELSYLKEQVDGAKKQAGDLESTQDISSQTIQGLKENISQLEKQNEELVEQINQKNERSSQLEETSKHLEADLNDIKNRLESKTQELTNLENNYNESIENNKHLEDKNTELQSQLDSKVNFIQELESQLSQIQQELENLNQQLIEKENDLKQKISEISILQQEFAQVQSDTSILEERIREKETEVEILEAKMQNELANNDAERTEAQNKVKELYEKETETLKNQISELNSQNQDHLIQINEIRSERESEINEKNKLSSDVSKLREMNNTLKQKFIEAQNLFKNKFEELKESKLNTEQNLIQMEAEQENKSQKIDDLENEGLTLKTEIFDLQNQLTSKNEELESIIQDKEKQDEEIKLLGISKDTLQMDLSDLQDKNESLSLNIQKQIETIESLNQNLTSNETEKGEKLENLIKLNSDLSQDIVNLQNEVDNLSSKVTSSKNNHDSILKQRDDDYLRLKAKLNDTMVEKDKIQQDLDRTLIQNCEQDGNMNEIQSRIEDLKTENYQKMEEISSLQLKNQNLKSENQNIAFEFESQIEELKFKIEEKQNLVSKLEKEIIEKTNQIESSGSKIDSLEKIVKQMNENIKSQRDLIDQKNKELLNFQDSIGNIQNEISDGGEEIKNLKLALKDKNDKFEKNENELNSQLQNLSNLREDNDYLKKQVDKYASQVSLLEESLKVSSTSSDKLNSLIALKTSLEKDLQNERQRSSSLKREKEGLSIQFDNSCMTSTKLESQLIAYTSALQNQKEENVRLRQSLDNQKDSFLSEKTMLEDKIFEKEEQQQKLLQQQQIQLQEKQDQIPEAAFKELSQKSEKLTVENQTLNKKVTGLNSALSELEKMNQLLTSKLKERSASKFKRKTRTSVTRSSKDLKVQEVSQYNSSNYNTIDTQVLAQSKQQTATKTLTDIDYNLSKSGSKFQTGSKKTNETFQDSSIQNQNNTSNYKLVSNNSRSSQKGKIIVSGRKDVINQAPNVSNFGGSIIRHPVNQLRESSNSITRSIRNSTTRTDIIQAPLQERLISGPKVIVGRPMSKGVPILRGIEYKPQEIKRSPIYLPPQSARVLSSGVQPINSTFNTDNINDSTKGNVRSYSTGRPSYTIPSQGQTIGGLENKENVVRRVVHRVASKKGIPTPNNNMRMAPPPHIHNSMNKFN